MSELSDKLKALAERAAQGDLTDEDRVALAELGKAEGAKAPAQRLAELAKEAVKGLSPQAQRELQQIGETLSEGAIARYAFDALSPSAKADLIENGIRIIDATPPVEKLALKDGEMSRAHFDALSAVEKDQRMKAGVRVVDTPT